MITYHWRYGLYCLTVPYATKFYAKREAAEKTLARYNRFQKYILASENCEQLTIPVKPTDS